MYSQNNINNILDNRHSRDRLLVFRHVYLLVIQMHFFDILPPESLLEMLALVPVIFNNDIGVFSSTSRKEVSGYATFLTRRYGMEPGSDMVTVDCTNLVLNSIFKACLLESIPWLAVLTNRKKNYASFIPVHKYNKIDFIFSQYQVIHPDAQVKIHTEGEKSGLVSIL